MSKIANITVLYVYLDYNDSRQQTLENLFGSLARQLFQDHPSTFPSAKVAKLMNRMWKDANRPKLKDIISVLRSEIQKFQRVYLIVDALDECDETTRHGLELQLKELQSSKLSVIVTSRCLRVPSNIHIDCNGCGKENLRLFYHCKICNEGNFDLCQDCVDGQVSCRDESHSLSEPYSAVEIDMVTPDHEIRRFVQIRLEGNNGESSHGDQDERRARSPISTILARICYQDPQLKDLISSTVVGKANGNFLIARRYTDSLRRQDTVEQVKQLLKNPSDLLDSHYDQIMRRINAQYSESLDLAHKALPWIVHSYRPLVFEELQQAMAIVLGADDIDLDAFFEIDSLLSVTAGLVTVDSEQAVRLVHQTAQMYLDVQAKQWFPSAEIDIALAILSYIRIEAISNPCSGNRDDHEFKARRESHPFFLYAAVYWGDHVRKVIHDPIVQAAVLMFVRNPSNLASCLQAASWADASWAVSTGRPTEWDPRRSPSSLHECAKFGLTPLIPDLLNDGYDIDSQDLTHGLTALMCACQVGYVETVKLLLDLGASVNVRSVNGTTALFEAVSGGHTDSVELLLKKKDLDIDAVYAGHTQRTVLMIAARNGAEEVVRCLLQRVDMDINKADASGSTALILAAAEGHTSVVSLLLDDEGIDINASDHQGHSALIIAAARGLQAIVKQLLAKGATALIAAHHGYTTNIQRAVLQGQVSAVETMVAHGANIRSLDSLGKSLLHDATLAGSSEIVRLLLRNGLDPNARCHHGYTPLHYASLLHKPSVTKVLLDSGADPSLIDSYGRSPRVVAWQEGHVRLARMFEEKDNTAGIEEEIPTEIAKTLPIWSIAKLGRIDLLEPILNSGRGFEDKNPYTNDSAVHLAVSCKHNDILEILLNTKNSPNCLNNRQETPLHIAARVCNTQAVDLLLQHHAVINPVDEFGNTPLQLALGQAEYQIAIQLIHASLDRIIDAKIEIPKEYVQLLFFSAIELGNAKVLEFLIDKGADIMAKNKNGRTALQLAETAGFGDVIETLETRMEFFKYKKRTTVLEKIEE